MRKTYQKPNVDLVEADVTSFICASTLNSVIMNNGVPEPMDIIWGGIDNEGTVDPL